MRNPWKSVDEFRLAKGAEEKSRGSASKPMLPCVSEVVPPKAGSLEQDFEAELDLAHVGGERTDVAG